MKLELETPVLCADGPFGGLADVVIDPTSRRVTHLVVEPQGRHGLARLVPIELAARGDGRSSAISLRCTLAEADRLPPVQEYAYLRLDKSLAGDPDWDVGIENVLALPYYGYVGSGFAEFGETPVDPHVSITYDRIPKGEVEIRRASEVTSSDGHRLGHVDGFLVDSDDKITHLILERGHVWGQREVTIPISAMTRAATDAVEVGLTKAEVGALPGIQVHRWLEHSTRKKERA